MKEKRGGGEVYRLGPQRGNDVGGQRGRAAGLKRKRSERQTGDLESVLNLVGLQGGWRGPQDHVS